MPNEHMDLLDWWMDWIPGRDRMRVRFFDRYPTTAPPAVPAVMALERALLDSGYEPREGSPIGSYAARYVGGGALQYDADGKLLLRSPDTGRPVSLHAVPIALDVEYDRNPYLSEPVPRGFGTDDRFALTEANVAAAEAIVNVHGERIWRWLGYGLGDTMHFQLDVPPDRCAPAPQGGNEVEPITTERWRALLRPEDVDAMAAAGVITEDERRYWRDLPADEDYDDLRDAWNARQAFRFGGRS